MEPKTVRKKGGKNPINIMSKAKRQVIIFI